MNSKTKIMFGLATSGLVFLGAALFLLGSKGDFKPVMMAQVGGAVLLGLAAAYIMVERARDDRRGFPVEDEYTKRLSHKVGAYAYYATIWLAVGLIWYNGLISDKLGSKALEAGESLGALVILSGIAYFITYFVLKGRGEA